MRCALQPAIRAIAKIGVKELCRQLKHIVYESAVEVYICADALYILRSLAITSGASRSTSV